ncbi:CIA30 family protein [Nitrosomonas aestuarii]|uniref:CIA30 family protein n=1 Tax=Nitrosomonas aestuarii TaxID=52441 RepID=UPI001FCCCBBB|nr:CIA30 family protein [Nitrosomonas aestuarii]
MAKDLIIDDRTSGNLISSLGTPWRLVTDQVMGGVSSGNLTLDNYKGRDCLRLYGDVSTENNGGFVQIALNLTKDESFDASAYAGIELSVSGNNEQYNVHFRTTDLWLPWQSYRFSFKATPEWQTIRIPFANIEPYRTTTKFHKDKLRRIGLVAIGRAFEADLCVASLKFYVVD